MSQDRPLSHAEPAVRIPETHDVRIPIALFLVAAFVNFYGIGWGLPNGNATWANDAIVPGAPLSILYRVFIAEPINSGWFWFKYPPGHVFILGAVYAPFMAWQIATGAISDPTSEYPYGMEDPEMTLAVLALLARSVSALMGAGCVALVFLAMRDAFGRTAAVCGALAAAFCYPVVYYSHTSNVEVPYMFWMLLAFLASVRLIGGDDRRQWWIALAIGAGMSVSTKELGAGFFLALPPIIAASYLAKRRPLSELAVGGAIAAGAALVTLVVANNVILNPTGFLNRIGFLTQTLPEKVALQYAPYYFPIQLGAGKDLAAELGQLSFAVRRVYESLGLIPSILAPIGIVLAARRSPWWTVLALGAAIAFYMLGARAMLSLSLRYVMPITVIATMFAGVAFAVLFEPGPARTARRAVAVLAAVYVFAYGWDVNRMLAGDARYGAESWIAANVRDGEVVEVYQRPTYLPRFPDSITVNTVPFNDRTVEQFRQRDPDYVILSSAGIAGVTLAYKTDWKSERVDSDEWVPSQRASDGTVMNYRRKANLELLDGIESGALGYDQAAHFAFEPWIDRTLIQSLNPQITIFRRVRAARDSHRDAGTG